MNKQLEDKLAHAKRETKALRRKLDQIARQTSYFQCEEGKREPRRSSCLTCWK